QILYDGFFGEVRKLIDNAAFAKKRAARCGVVGVFWPSILWPDEKAVVAEQSPGGAAALGQAAKDPAQLPALADLVKVFGDDHADTLHRILELLEKRQGGEAGLREVSEKLTSLLQNQDKKTATEDSAEFDTLVHRPDAWKEAFKALSDDEAVEAQG